MAVDKLVDSSRLDTDLTSVANAIRTKGGTSAQLAFPAGFVSAVQAIPTGGSSVKRAIAFENYVMPAGKWLSQDCVPNYIATGGCLHIIYTLQPNSNTSADRMILGIGVGAMSAWSPNSSTPCMYPISPKNTTDPANYDLGFYLRGPGNASIWPSSLQDENKKLDLKFYADHYVDVHTGTSYEYTAAQQSWWDVLVTKPYLSIGCNQSAPLTGAVIELFAIEEA